MHEPDQPQAPVKDEEAAHPIADAWRPVLRDIVSAFVGGDYALSHGIPCVAPVAVSTAEQVRSYIADYGATLAELPDTTWRTSVAQWMGSYWDVLVDLWTVESGASDLVLCARVFEVEDGFRVEIHSVHVP